MKQAYITPIKIVAILTSFTIFTNSRYVSNKHVNYFSPHPFFK